MSFHHALSTDSQQTLDSHPPHPFSPPPAANSPGFVYDPLESFAFYDKEFKGSLGSKSNVTLEECQVACQMAETCESVSYNDALMKCFLKRGQCAGWNSCAPAPETCKSTNDRGGVFEFKCGTWRTVYRLDVAGAANCEGYAPPPVWALEPTPDVLARFDAWQAENPGAVLRATPPIPEGLAAPEPAEPAAVAPAGKAPAAAASVALPGPAGAGAAPVVPATAGPA